MLFGGGFASVLIVLVDAGVVRCRFGFIRLRQEADGADVEEEREGCGDWIWLHGEYWATERLIEKNRLMEILRDRGDR